MTQLLHIISSSQGEASQSTALAKAYLAERQARDPAIALDTLDLWQEPLPEYDGDKVAAKATFFGFGEMTENLQSHWDQIVAVVDRFKRADELVLSVPMWNGNVPYKLKHYIDVITQPGLTYRFDPETGYTGLVTAVRATVFYTSGVYHPDAPPSWGEDFHSTYVSWYLGFLGVADTQSVRLQPSAVNPDPAREFNAALAASRALASGLPRARTLSGDTL